ncbi:MAG: tetraacyldisaccharide 4'-kinase [Planctomycetota bacterium]|nr:tetraacyldisaccharide 4'-kinase [Planctomycetota bacterium]
MEPILPWPRPILSLLEACWRGVIGIDRWRHQRRERSGEWPLKLPVPVVSIGNIAVGGTGKTPITEALARHWLQRGGRPGIVSRGYRGGPEGNDEFAMLRRALPEVPHQQHRCRHAAGTRLLEEHPDTDLILVDDGFQHRRLHRDVDLVLLDALEPLAGGHCLPLGRLREPWRQLARADHLILTGAQRCVDVQLSQSVGFLRQWFPGIPRSLASTRLADVRVLCGEDRTTPDPAIPVLGFCGIGTPDSFRDSLVEGGWNLCAWRSLADHHRYSTRDLERLSRAAISAGAQALVCTAKDAPKIERLLASGYNCQLPILVQEMQISLDVGPILAGIDASTASGTRETSAPSC